MALHVLLFLFLLIPSLLEGLGLWVDRRIFLLYFSTISSFFYIYGSFFPVPIKIPLKAGISYVSFLFFLSISTFFFSLDKQTSFELLLLYYSSFLFFIFFYNRKKSTYWFAYYFPIVLGVFFTCYSFLLPFFRQKGLNLLLPVIEKQFVFASYANHNHLGDLMGLLVIILSYYCFQKKWAFVPFFLFFSVILIVSFSRSAYVAFFIVFILMLFYARKRISSFLLPLFFLFLSTIIFITYLTSVQQPVGSPFFTLQTFGKTVLNISPRDTISGRDVFVKQALLSIQKYPLFGIGGGNFIIASQNNIINTVFSDSAHNIFLQLATEQGVFATLCFLLFVFLVLRRVFLSPSLPGFLFLYLLLNFQTDYTYQIYSLFLFWIILSAG
ncbi:MAG: O-antigen ligase family protein, partial [bacterium]